MATVKIGFCTSDWWVSRVIRYFTKAKVSHAYLVFDDPGCLFGAQVFEAAWCGFRISTRSILTRGTTRIVQEIPVAIDPSAALGVCERWAGTPYDYLGLLGEAVVQVGRLFGKRWRNPFAGAHHMFCSEACVYVLAACGEPRVAGLDARSTSPEDLLEILSVPAHPVAAVEGVQ